jgi:hypothetical protein
MQVYHGDTLVFDQDVGALQTYRTSGAIGIPEGDSLLRFVSTTGTTSPAALGLGTDSRQLSFALLDVQLETRQLPFGSR